MRGHLRVFDDQARLPVAVQRPRVEIGAANQHAVVGQDNLGVRQAPDASTQLPSVLQVLEVVLKRPLHRRGVRRAGTMKRTCTPRRAAAMIRSSVPVSAT